MVARRHCTRLPGVVGCGCNGAVGAVGAVGAHGYGADDDVAGYAEFLANVVCLEASEKVDDRTPRGSMGRGLGGQDQSSQRWDGVTVVHHFASLLANEQA